MFGDEDDAFVDIKFKAMVVECSKKYICGHNRTGDASPALDVHHMPTNVDKAGSIFRVVSAAARMISSRRLFIANEILERSASIPTIPSFTCFPMTILNSFMFAWKPCIRLLWLQKLQETPLSRMPRRCRVARS